MHLIGWRGYCICGHDGVRDGCDSECECEFEYHHHTNDRAGLKLAERGMDGWEKAGDDALNRG